MNRNFNKFMFLVVIDLFLTAVDFVEAYDVGYIEDYYEEPYEFDGDKKAANFKEMIDAS